MPPPLTLIAADIVTPRERGGVLNLPQGGLAFNASGCILQVGRHDDLASLYPDARRIDARGCLLLPGLIDTHSHVSQYGISGAGAPPLLDWLRGYVFPAEARFSDPARAAETWAACDTFFRRCLAEGTTTVNTLTTSSPAATEVAFAAASAAGIRALIGPVLMDSGGEESRPLLRDVAESEAGLERLRERWHGREGRLWVTVCPRGVFACSEKLLRFAGEYARQWELLLHSHLDMDDGFRPFVRELFPSAPDTLAVFEKARCLGPRSVWAHATGLTPGEVARLGPASGVAHCAPSNLFWSMGLMPLRAVQRSGAAVGLGSDSGGGPTVSLFDAMRAAGDVSRLIPGEEPASVEELLTLATLGGARVLGLADHIGSLEPWKQADFILVDDARCDPLYPEGRSPYQSLTDRLSRVIYRPASGMVRATFVGGRPVFGRDGLGGWLA